MYQRQGQRRLILIALDWTRPKDPPMSLGHASIYTNLVKNNIEVIQNAYAVNSPSFNVNEVISFIQQHGNETTDVALGAYVWNEKDIQKIIKSLKKYKYPGRIILGGPQISYLKEKHEEYYPEVDIFIKGYAENSILKLMRASKSYQGIPGVKYAGEPNLGHC